MTLLTEIPKNKNQLPFWIQLNLSKAATLGTEESGHCKEVVVVERFQTSRMYGFFVRRDQKIGHCREVTVSRGSTVLFKKAGTFYTVYSFYVFLQTQYKFIMIKQMLQTVQVWIKPNFHGMQQDLPLNLTISVVIQDHKRHQVFYLEQ